MTNLCVRCEKAGPHDRMVTVVNPYHNGPRWIDVCVDCIRLGDRVVGPEDDDDDDEDGYCSLCDAECSGHY